MLFETGPGNAWIVGPVARAARRIRAARSFAIEIYERLPNDTDFSILKRHDIPGLNFAPIGDSYAYHTARDTVERLSPTRRCMHDRRERRGDDRAARRAGPRLSASAAEARSSTSARRSRCRGDRDGAG